MFQPFRIAATALAALALPAAALAAPVVTAPAGPVSGSEERGVRVFRGIPYAQPPVGAARWTAPRAMPDWTAPRDATRFGPACIQPEVKASLYSDAGLEMSEDCLSLNIWAPVDAAARRLPVFVWIHGGALMSGEGASPIYDGAKLARRDMVVVSINYRLGVLGYLAHAGLSAEAGGTSGNYGLLDQIAALEWVKRNIAAFGGDPGNVTVAGESAGALSVMYLMASPAARGLFHKAVAQSGYFIPTPELRVAKHGNEAAEAIGQKVLAAAGAADIAALRAMPAKAVRDAAARSGYAPFGTVDGKLLPRQLVDTFDRGEQAEVPILAGYNSGEIRTLRFLLPPATDAATYERKVRENYGADADLFLKLYPSRDMAESALAHVRDAMYGWTAQRLAERQVALGAPGYLYLFDHGWPGTAEYDVHGFHAAEIPFVFGTNDRTPRLWPKANRLIDAQLSDAMQGYWASFAKTGKPTARGQADWLQVGDVGAFLWLANTPRMALQPMRGAYALHERAMCRNRAAGNLPWAWNSGTLAPPLPPEAPACR